MIGRVSSRADAPAAATPVVPPEVADALAAHRRPGITSPAVPQRHAVVEVLASPGVSAAVLLERVRAAHSALPPQTEDAGEVTVTIGFSPAHARELWPERAASSSDLPSFASDAAGIVTGGDIAVQVCAETASAALDAATYVRAALGEPVPVWTQTGYRDAPTPQGTSRTGLGFIDGIMNPSTAEDHDTHWVLRRMRVSADFGRMSSGQQERAVGRRRDSGAPLSGGGERDEIDLFAKESDGSLLIPVDAHARRAHPAHIGRALMLRRSYSADLEGDAGLLFVAFLSDPSTFVLTQRRLDEMDALIAHTRTEASGLFFVPGDV
jgi:dye decolorizing peroxidase